MTPTQDPAPVPPEGLGLRRYDRAAVRLGMAIQKSRAAVYTLAGTMGILAILFGLMPARLSDMVAVLVAAYLCTAFFYLLYLWQERSRRNVELAPLWLGCDAVLVTWTVHCTGGMASVWFPWYLANISGAAFVAGEGGAFLVALVDTAAYMGLLAWRGDISVATDIYRPLAHMVFLYGASFFFLRGVTYLKRRQHLIREMRDAERRKVDELKRLAAELDQRTRQLQATNLELHEATRLKGQFLANMSHELRTPLNSIIGFSEILLRKAGGELDPKHVKFLDNINSSGQHLLRLINDILDLAKIEVGRLELQPAELAAETVVDGVVTIVKGSTRERRITVVTNLPAQPLSFEADPARMKQILYNLLTNAVKFSSDGATVEVNVRAVDAEASPLGLDSVEVAVVDHGIGIDPKDQLLIFEEFRQVDGSSTRRFEGAGLGLALVKRFVELHRGIVTVDSAPGQGSTFTVTLPQRYRCRDKVQRPLTERLSVRIEGNRTILVVEDDPTAFETISRHLSGTEYIPVRAHNGHEAIEMVEGVRPVAIILDIILPGMDGWEVLKRLKSASGTEAIPVIIVSMLDSRELGLTLGADDFFTKPVDGARLCARLSELVLPVGQDGARVLVIDDDPVLHEVLTAQLPSRGFELSHAMSGKEGLELARSTRPDLIILDLMMEEMDGFEVAAVLKQQTETAQLPIVVLTAKDLSGEDRQRLRGKIEALLQKATSTNAELISVIERLLARGTRRRAGATDSRDGPEEPRATHDSQGVEP